MVSEESHALAWREVAAIAADPAGDASMRRMAGKWLARSPALGQVAPVASGSGQR